MKVKLTNGRPALPSDIETLERTFGRALPKSYLEFVRKHDGAEPENNIFKIEGALESGGISRFIPIREIPDERVYVENIPFSAFPIAWAEGGNYIFIDVASASIYFWDHEVPDPPVQVATDFDFFIEMLEPFDVSSVKLKPDQVKGVWIDPDFLKSLEE